MPFLITGGHCAVLATAEAPSEGVSVGIGAVMTFAPSDDTAEPLTPSRTFPSGPPTTYAS